MSGLSSAQVSSRGDVIERTRSYRTPPSTTSIPCELIKAVTRPDDGGTRGVLINLLVNWFRIKYDRTRIFIYKVSMVEEAQMQAGRGRRGPAKPSPPISHSGTIAKIFWEAIRSYRDIFPDRHKIVFDDFEYLFTPDRIVMNEAKGLILSCNHPEKEGKRVKVEINCFEKFDLDLSGDMDSNPNSSWTAIFLKNLLSQNTRYTPPENCDPHEKEVSERFAHLNGGLYFIPRTPNAPKVVIQPGVQSWLGLYASVRRMQNFDPVINFGLVNMLFVQLNLDLITFYLAIENDTLSSNLTEQFPSLQGDLCMSRDQAINFNHKLKDIKLKCECVPGKDKDGIVTGRVERHYKFIELQDSRADLEYLDVEDLTAREDIFKQIRGRDGRMKPIRRRWRRVRMDDWYASQGKPLNYPKLPLCLVKSGKKEDLIPMEVLFTHDQPQKFIKLLNFYARMRIPKLLSRPPVQHHKFTNKLLTDKLEYDKDPFMKAMKISLDPKMIECEGRVVEPCAVLAKSDSDESLTRLEVKKDTGEFYISRAMETSTKKIRFVVYKLTDAVNQTEVREFYQELVKKCVARGFNVPESDYNKPPIWKEEVIERDDGMMIARMMEDHLAMFEKSGKTEDEFLVFVFVTKMRDDLYGEIKYLSDIRYGVVSQVVDEETVRKACTKSDDERPSDYKSIYHHLCLKLNAKLGGINQIVAEEDEPEYGRMPSNERTMFIGIDVIHPSPNSPIRDLSLAAIVASMDKNTAKYAVRIKVNSRCNENVQQFDEHFSCLLEKYHSLNGYLPDRVVILRDGVSDSEMVKAASLELNSIKVAWKKCSNGKKCPPFTYIVAQKRHKTRFYRRPDEEKGDVKNAPMGTIVDRAVVTPHMFDFYMVTHYAQLGTSRPIHYTVVYDDCDSSSDVIQELLFRLCFLYARCSKPVSIPSPVYYAHLACERAAFQHQYAIRTGEVNEILDRGETESDRDYASRVEKQAQIIERKLQVSKKHPGMYFI